MVRVKVTKKQEKRKAEIMYGSERLFYDKRFEDTSISEISKAIGISQGTFYYYFKSRKIEGLKGVDFFVFL